MTNLIATLGSDKGTRLHLEKVIEGQDWDNIYIISTVENKENFNITKKANYVIIENKNTISELREAIKKQLGRNIYIEVAVNIVSGSGKEHTALVSAIMQSGCGFRFVALTKDGVKEV